MGTPPRVGAAFVLPVRPDQEMAAALAPVGVRHSFHPSQLGNALGTMFFWERLETELPSWIGPVNPYNEQIDQLFGDQGGH